jgi:hypothetical protein
MFCLLYQELSCFTLEIIWLIVQVGKRFFLMHTLVHPLHCKGITKHTAIIVA